MQDNAQETRQSSGWEQLGLPTLFRAFGLSKNLNALGFALAGVILIWLAGKVLDRAWPDEHKVIKVDNLDELEVFTISGFDFAATDEFIRGQSVALRQGPGETLTLFLRRSTNRLSDAVLSARLFSASPEQPGAFRAALAIPASPFWLFRFHPVYAILLTVITAFILTFSAGAISRIAALQATRDERISLGEAWKFTLSKWIQFISAPAIVIGFIAVLGLCLALGGVFASISVVNILMALLWGLALIGGFIIAALAVGGLLGWPLWFPTVAVEGSDAFDALSRSYSYVAQRPWKALFYALATVVYGTLCFTFIKFFARVMLWSTHFWVGVGMFSDAKVTPPPPATQTVIEEPQALWQSPRADSPFWGDFAYLDQLEGTSYITAHIIRIWIMIVVMLVAAWGLSFFCSASTLIYLLLRRDVDGTELEEVWIEEEERDLFESPPPAPESSGSTSLPVIESSSEPTPPPVS